MPCFQGVCVESSERAGFDTSYLLLSNYCGSLWTTRQSNKPHFACNLHVARLPDSSVRCPAHSYLLHVLPCCRSLDRPLAKAWPIYPFRSRPVPWIRARHPPGHHVDARCLSWPCAASIALKWRCTCPANTCVRCGLLLVNERFGAGSLPVHCEALPLNPRFRPVRFAHVSVGLGVS